MCWNVSLKDSDESLVWFIVFQKKGKKLYDLGCKTMTTKVVSKDVGVKENGAKGCVTQEYFLMHVPGLTCGKCVYELEDHVG